MCGIAGVVEPGVRSPGLRLVSRMLNAIRHRGPDQFGIYHDESVALGNARLSIIDLASGQQPISNDDGRYWIVFNGEIFNYRELRSQLQGRGHRFSTQSDTEVFVHLYEEYGPASLRLLNGQFAVAIWDRVEHTLFLARDRLGVRPLFYFAKNGCLRFASEIKALFVDPEVDSAIDPKALAQVFEYWSCLTPHTIFRSVLEIPPGHYAIWQDGRLRLHRYWQLDFAQPVSGSGWVPSPAKRGEAIEQFRTLLQDAVRLRLRADVPVGAYLSGGLDSSAITALIRQETSTHLHTFSISFADPRYDETEHQKEMARFLGTEHHVIRATNQDIAQAFPDVVSHAETPILRTAPVPMFLLSRLVRNYGIKVVLTGEGADEFLGGYDIFKEAVIREFWSRQPNSKWRPALFGRLYPEIAQLSGTSPAYLAAFFRDSLNPEEPYFSHALRWRNGRQLFRFFSDAVRSECATGSYLRPELHPEFSRWGALERAQYLEATVFLSEYLLSSQGDRMGMAHSVEGRFPFLDHRVVQFATELPPYWKLHGLHEKYLLREMARPLLPQAIGRRRKRPYRAPIRDCFFPPQDQPVYVQEFLSPESIRSSGFFNANAVARLVRKAGSGAPVSETDEMALAGILSTQIIDCRFAREAHTTAPLSNADDVKICQGVEHYATNQAII